MKKAIVLLITVFFSLISFANAQTNEAQQRERDIKIAEGILAEIFGNEQSQSGSAVLPGLQHRNVRGEYIPGFGVHFTVSPGWSNFVYVQNVSSKNDEVRVEFQQDGSSSDSSDNEEEIRHKILEYMTKYAPLVSGVSDDETIRVTYAPNQYEAATWGFVYDSYQTNESKPGLSVWAKVSDLKQFRNGNISERQLMNRINIHTLDNDETYTDFNIFASVLETALNSADAKHLRVSRKPQMEYLHGLGVRYRVQVSARPRVILDEIRIFDGNFDFKIDSLRLNLDKSLKLMDESLSPVVLQIDSMLDEDLSEDERELIRRNMQQQRAEIQAQREKLKNSLRNANRTSPSSDDSLDLEDEAEAIMDQLLNVIDDYGSTLSSLDDDEMLMISVNWSGRSDNLPERTEVRIKKSDLLRGEEPDIEVIERR